MYILYFAVALVKHVAAAAHAIVHVAKVVVDLAAAGLRAVLADSGLCESC